jgi:hypothetical protein
MHLALAEVQVYLVHGERPAEALCHATKAEKGLGAFNVRQHRIGQQIPLALAPDLRVHCLNLRLGVHTREACTG